MIDALTSIIEQLLSVTTPPTASIMLFPSSFHSVVAYLYWPESRQNIVSCMPICACTDDEPCAGMCVGTRWKCCFFMQTLRQWEGIWDSNPDMEYIRPPTLIPFRIYQTWNTAVSEENLRVAILLCFSILRMLPRHLIRNHSQICLKLANDFCTLAGLIILAELHEIISFT